MSDGWDSPDNQVNQIGTFVIVIPAMLAALLAWGVFGEVSTTALCVLVAVTSAVGGAMNAVGKGSPLVGVLIGLLLGFGGFAAVLLWIRGRESVSMIEVGVAFLVGVVPAFVLLHFVKRASRGSATE